MAARHCGIALLAVLLVVASKVDSKTDGNWGSWSEWSGWATGLCAGNQRVRTRPCTNPVPSGGGKYCEGDNAENQPGPVHGGFTEWSQWSACSKPCGGSQVNRTRTCTSPAPKNNGNPCTGTTVEFKLECLSKCQEGRTDGKWSLWGPWSPCPKVCSKAGGAKISRYRSCTVPPPSNGGKTCEGTAKEEITSCFKSCPRDGGFGPWTGWGTCSKTCGHGIQMRRRFCNNPEPANGRNCTGVWSDQRPCKLIDCVGVVDGGWSEYGPWSTCTESTYCFEGKTKRVRSCTNPAPSVSGRNCLGATEEVKLCPSTSCTEKKPTPPSKVTITKDEYIARECGVLEKFASSGDFASKVPASVYNSILAFKKGNFLNGYFNTRLEESGKILKICFEPIPALTIKEAADKVQSYRKAVLLPEFKRPTDESTPTLGFSIRVKNEAGYALKGYDFGVTLVDQYVPGAQLYLHNVMFTYYSEGNFFGFLAKGEYRKFEPTIFDAVVFHNVSQATTMFVANAKKMLFRTFLNVLGLGGDKTPGWMKAGLQAIQIWDAEFGPVQLAYDFVKAWLAPFRFTATKRILGIPLHLEVVFVAHPANPQIAFGIVFDGESFGAVLDKVSGVSADLGGFFKAIGLQIEVGVVLCPEITGEIFTSPATQFSKEPLVAFSKHIIPAGLSVIGQISFPKDCKGSTFCQICKKILGPDARFRIGATVQSKYYKISAGFYKIRITENIYFWKLELWIEANTTEAKAKKTVGFKVEVKFPIPGDVIVDGIKQESSLVVGGIIKHEIGTNDISGQLYMRGLWRKAFGVEWLTIGNINLGLTITIGVPFPITGFQFGGQLEFGRNCIYEADFGNDGHCLRVLIYFGIGKPSSYFYGSITALTIGKIMRMAGSTASVPAAIKESGFPKGLSISYAKEGVDLRVAGGPYVPGGFRFTGTVNILGYEIYAEIRYSETEIYIVGTLDPIILGGGIIKVTRNKDTTKLGPTFKFHYRQPAAIFAPLKAPYLMIFFEGYADVFGIKAYCFINITFEAMEILVWGNFWNLVYAEVYISAGYKVLDITNAHFYVRVILDLKGLNDAIDSAKSEINSAFEKAKAHLDGAIKKVRDAKKKCKEKMQLKCQRCKDLKCKEAEDNCKNFLNAAGKWIGGAINAAGKWIANAAKTVGRALKKVGNAVKKFFSGWRRRRAVQDSRNAVFEEHIRTRRFISKLLCEGLVGGGCKGISKFCEGACKAVEAIGKGLCNVLDVAVGVLKAAQAVSGWINAAIQFLLDVFRLYSVKFEFGLGKKFNGFTVAAEIDMAIFRQRMRFGFMFNAQDKKGSILGAKNSGLDDYKKGVKQSQTGTNIQVYDPPNPFSDFDLSNAFGVEARETGLDNRLGGCVAALSKNNGAQLKVIGCNETDERQRWTFSLDGLLVNQYSSKCLDMRGGFGAALTLQDCNHKLDSQRLQCSVVARTIKRRRSQYCAITGKSTPKGPGSLYHLGSLKCINLASDRSLVLMGTCHVTGTEFEINDAGHLIHKESGDCVIPKNGAALANAKLTLSNSNCHQFTFTSFGSLQHLPSRLCVQTTNKEMKPADNTPLILNTNCEKVGGGSKYNDPQMLFSFVPTDNSVKLGDCDESDYLKPEKRFEVMNDDLSTVCSKFQKDLALRKNVVQSSTLHNAWASRAVDGNYRFHWKDKSCTHTNKETNPWWRVDLGKEYIVTDVTMINRGEHGERFNNVEVRVGNLLDNMKNPICHDRTGQSYNGEAIRLQCEPPIPGRYVSLNMRQTEYLTVCEVIVKSRVGGLSNKCLFENGGCEQVCIDKCGQQTLCGCYKGYNLAYDGKNCIDIDECQINNGGCRTDTKASCVNFPGSFYCACPAGYILRDNNEKECMDFNECGVKNGGCEQMCNNVDGGYLCECKVGYERKKDDDFGCQDVDECKVNSGGCSQICTNFEGSFHCSCRPGFRLQDDMKTCEEIYCPVLYQAPYLSVTPGQPCLNVFANINIGQTCTFECNTGYEMPGGQLNDAITCQVTGNWNKASPSCAAVKCPALPKPANGGVVPADCHAAGAREYGQRCVHYCKHGYGLKGPATKYCQADKQWSSTASVECVKVLLPPYLNCPTDLVVDLPPTAGSMALGKDYRKPQTNMNVTKTIPPNVGPDFVFSAGTTTVVYHAIGEKGKKLSCSFIVELKDVTPPVISGCPNDIYYQEEGFNRIVTWTEPTFTDNVAIKDIIRPSQQSGSPFRAGDSVSLQYRVIDTSGNTAYCNFKVTIDRKFCPELTQTKGATVAVTIPKSQYTVNCWPRTMVGGFGQYGNAYCKNGQYEIKNTKIGIIAPACVSFRNVLKETVCDAGEVKRSVISFFGQVTYTCENCPPGTYHNQTLAECIPCLIGSYQDGEKKLDCQICNRTMTTKDVGATSPSDCIAQCRPGYFSINGLDESANRCQKCPKGSYSYNEGAKKCEVCPAGSSTAAAGAKSEQDCFAAPSIIKTIPESVLSAIVGDPFTVECRYSGRPAPDAVWKRVDGTPLRANVTQQKIFNTNFEEVGVMLRAPSATLQDRGFYKCEIENKHGVDQKQIEIQVEEQNVVPQ